LKKKDDEANYGWTVQGYVESEAESHKHDVAENEDEFCEFFMTLEGAASLWAKKTYQKLDTGARCMVKSGMLMRLDRIDDKYTGELCELMEDCVHKWKAAQPAPASPEDDPGEDGPSTAPPATAPPERLLTPA
jgi:hypothetical protein